MLFLGKQHFQIHQQAEIWFEIITIAAIKELKEK